MRHLRPSQSPLVGGSYVVCRFGGRPPELVQSELGLTSEAVAHLERLFRGRAGGGADPMKPRFARHDELVAASVALGGFPVLRRL
jgi:hypothetical protein